MYKVMVFGSGSLPDITQDIANAIVSLNSQGDCQFLIGDGKMLDQKINLFMSRAGLTDKTLVIGIDRIRNNNYGHPECVLHAEYDSEAESVSVVDNNGNVVHVEYGVEDMKKFTESDKWGTMALRATADMCDIAICLWDGKTKVQSKLIDYLRIRNKPCYLYTVDI